MEADNGQAALDACRAAPPDAVLLDIEMPGLDGHQVLSALESDVQLRDVPVVFLTGRTTTEDVVEGLRLGAHDYLKKPFEVSELIARVTAAVRVKALQDELRTRNAELDLISRTDALTRLFNRRHLLERLDDLALAARGQRHLVGAIIFDIDHFKRINDTAGHAGGDAVLQEFALRLQTVFREGGIACRWGGEEFLVLVPTADCEGVRKLAERARACIADTPFVIPGGRTMPVTASAGYAVDGGDDPNGLIVRADGALYAAKESGRNRVHG
jgi:diguanylate cyclase (GGDEF)-like protein